ncbi:MAG TPA: hypothetical protein VKB68_08595 [Stellaceae bacterium]|nr:hypothetical protein [Stellaceae bacterium]
MTSEAKIVANRRNALKSTGPKTERGKERARLNALRHGMTAKQLVASDEDFGDFARFNAELRATLAPADAVEEQLVDGIVVSTWRLRRAWRTEAAVIKLEARRADYWDKPHVAAVPVSRAAQELERISRYEAALERLIQRAYAALERRQARRAAAPASASTQAPDLQNEAKLG